MTALDSLSSRQQAEFLLEPNNLSNETLVRLVFKELSVSSRVEDLGSFFEEFVSGAAEVSVLITINILLLSLKSKDLYTDLSDLLCYFFQQNLTTIDPRVRDAILNLTLMALGPKLNMLDAEGFKLWFQVYLPLFLPSIGSSTFEIIPRNISCDSYQEM